MTQTVPVLSRPLKAIKNNLAVKTAMCVILAKYFPGIGWAGAKNRDRNYIPTLDFIIDSKNGVDRVMMHDQVTGYQEGLNNAGVSILNTSLDVQDDEQEVEKGLEDSSPDGKYIAEALLQTDPLDAVKILVKRKLGGCTIVFNKDDCYLIEASDQDGTEPYKHQIKKINPKNTVARTNHGLWLDWAGYQRQENDQSNTLSRISSEARLAQAQEIVKAARQPQDLVDGMCHVYSDNPQLNILRTSTERKKMRTTSQQLCVPSENTLYCRPVSSNLQFDFWKLNEPETRVWVEVLSNRPLWQKKEKHPPFSELNLKDEHESK